MAVKLYACVAYDTATETCAAHAYIDPPAGIPTLTAEEGAAIGVKLLGVFVMVKVISLLREAFRDRI